MGINEDIPAVLPISIGADETTMLELTGAYQVFARGGVARRPTRWRRSRRAGPSDLPARAARELRSSVRRVAYLITGALSRC